MRATLRDASHDQPDKHADIGRRLRDGTNELHRQAERTGVIRSLLRGTADRTAYALLLRNLHPVYDELELAIERLRESPGIRHLARRELYRSGALASDLDRIAGPAWRSSIVLLPASHAYSQRIATIATRAPSRLIGHAYVRYLGDLSGGQILRTLLARDLGLGADELRFYDFSDVADIESEKARFRRSLELAVAETGDSDAVVAEASQAFLDTIEVSGAVQRAADPETNSARAPRVG